ncbi:MAG: histidine kinase dimerization/phospho-acceptor domain-containing protein [Ilumatobacter fluminis]|uniref:GAF domain-containing sensor histidine kinase n=1 Tax=Ilumatobacter fluminis TaxID=467091 RepID=UPI0032ECA432
MTAEIALRLAAGADERLDADVAQILAQVGERYAHLGPRRLGVLRFPVAGAFQVVSMWVSDDAPQLRRPASGGSFQRRSERPYWYGQMLEASGPMFGRTVDLPDEARIEREIFEREGVATYAHAPIRSGGQTLGALIWAFTADHPADDPAVTALVDDAAALASAFSVPLLRMDSIDDPGAELALRLVRTDDRALRRTLHSILGELAGAVHADRASVLVAHPEDGTASLAVGWIDESKPLPPTMLAPDSARVSSNHWQWSVGQMLAGKAVRLDDIADAPPEAAADVATWGVDGVRSVLAFPLTTDGTFRGALILNRIEPGSWSDRQVHRCEMIATSVAAVVDRLTTAERERTEARRERDLLASTMELIGELSHELKTPLHTIAGFAELIDDSQLTESDRDALHTVRDAAARLGTVVDDLLTAAKPQDDASTEVLPVLQQVLKQFDSIAIAHAVDIDCSSLDPSTSVPFDAPRTRQLLRCLVSGALLGAGHGGTIAVRADDDGRTLVVDIDSTEVVPPAALGFPVAHAILGDVGSIEIDRLDDDPAAYGAVVRTRFRDSARAISGS